MIDCFDFTIKAFSHKLSLPSKRLISFPLFLPESFKYVFHYVQATVSRY